MAALSALRPEVQPHVPGCPLPMVDDAILKAVIDFCNRSRAYRFTPDDIDVVAGTSDYDVSGLPQQTAIAWLMSAELDGEPLEVPAIDSVPLSWADESGAPTVLVVTGDALVSLRRVPDESGTLRVSLALRPTLAASDFPDEFNALYQDALAAGALAKLYAMPKKDWSAPELVADCRMRFEAAVRAAEYRADRGSANAPARTALCLIGGR